MLLLTHSKWIDARITNSSTTAITIEKLQFMFSNLGLPEILVTDNSPSFSSSEFTDFMKANGIQKFTDSMVYAYDTDLRYVGLHSLTSHKPRTLECFQRDLVRVFEYSHFSYSISKCSSTHVEGTTMQALRVSSTQIEDVGLFGTYKSQSGAFSVSLILTISYKTTQFS